MGKTDFQLSYSISALVYINFLVLAISKILRKKCDGYILISLVGTALVAYPTFATMAQRKFKNSDKPNGYDLPANILNFFLSIYLGIFVFFGSETPKNNEEKDFQTTLQIYSVAFFVMTLADLIKISIYTHRLNN